MFLVDVQFPVSMIDPPWPPSLPPSPPSFILYSSDWWQARYQMWLPSHSIPCRLSYEAKVTKTYSNLRIEIQFNLLWLLYVMIKIEMERVLHAQGLKYWRDKWYVQTDVGRYMVVVSSSQLTTEWPYHNWHVVQWLLRTLWSLSKLKMKHITFNHTNIRTLSAKNHTYLNLLVPWQ